MLIVLEQCENLSNANNPNFNKTLINDHIHFEQPTLEDKYDFNITGISHYIDYINLLQFSPDITPLILASQKNQYEIVQLLLLRGEKVQKPHKFGCLCRECVNKMKFDQLRSAKYRLNAYRGLASEAYISLSSKDPILTAFQLSKELRLLSRNEKYFKVISNVTLNYHQLASCLYSETNIFPIISWLVQQSKDATYTSPPSIETYEPRYEKTGFLHLRKQRRRSAVCVGPGRKPRRPVFSQRGSYMVRL